MLRVGLVLRTFADLLHAAQSSYHSAQRERERERRLSFPLLTYMQHTYLVPMILCPIFIDLVTGCNRVQDPFKKVLPYILADGSSIWNTEYLND